MMDEISKAFQALSPKTRLPLGIAVGGTVIIDADGKHVARLPAATFNASYADALRFANMIVTAVNTCAGFRALNDGTWEPA
jgi:hypothetical protein